MILHHVRCATARRRSKKKETQKREDVPPKSKDVPPKRDHQRKREDVPPKKNKDVPPKRDRQKEIGITAKAYSHLLQTVRWQTNKRVRWQDVSHKEYGSSRVDKRFIPAS